MVVIQRCQNIKKYLTYIHNKENIFLELSIIKSNIEIDIKTSLPVSDDGCSSVNTGRPLAKKSMITANICGLTTLQLMSSSI